MFNIRNILRAMQNAVVVTRTSVRNMLRFDRASAVQRLVDPSKPDDDQPRNLDVAAQRVLTGVLQRLLPVSDWILLAEEAPHKTVFGTEKKAVLEILADPVDSTELTIAGLGGDIALTAIDRKTMEVIAAVVADIRTDEVFYACSGLPDAHVSYGQKPLPAYRIAPSGCVDLSQAFVSTFGLKSVTRWPYVASQYEGFRCRIFSTSFSGPISIVKVASGEIDVAFEELKGYKAIDLLPGYFIASRAGAECHQLSGAPIKICDDLNIRQSFICAATAKLFNQTQAELKRLASQSLAVAA